MNFSNKKFLVLGVSKSGKSAVKFLLSRGSKCYFYEELNSPKIENAISEITDLGAVRILDANDQKLMEIDACIISPGIPINHKIAVLMKNSGKRIIGELELGYEALMPQVVGITGTNGKTTTVTMLNDIIKNANKHIVAVGNIGCPITQELENITKQTICVVEVSSFQLESISSFKPDISCVLNITPDHLERHYTFDNYVFLKKRIFLNQKCGDFTVLNYDDEVVKGFASETKGKVVWVSVKNKINGAYEDNGNLYFNEEYIMPSTDIPIGGEHNKYNALFAIAVAKLMGINSEIIASSIREFKGVKHRLEFVAEKDGVKFYNDSKATNTSSTISAISSIKEPLVLILGGSEKGENYDLLFDKIKDSPIRHIVLTGASRYNMLNIAGKKGIGNVTVTPSFECSVKIANMFAEKGDVVLLSPACASFDAFSDYEERGNRFIDIVGSLN